MTPAKLRSHTCKDLARMARDRGVPGWHAMRKDQLIAALAADAQRKPGTQPSDASSRADREPESDAPKPLPRRRPTAAQRRITQMQQERQRLQDLSHCGGSPASDRLLLMARDSYWLQAQWEVRPESVARARTALGHAWHGAKPALRVSRLDDGGSVLASRQIEVHGGVGHWYVDVAEPPARFRAEVGYSTPHGEFYCLARSNEVTTPAPGVSDAAAANWEDVARNADRLWARSGGYSDDGASQELRQALEERLRRRLGRPTDTRFVDGSGLASQSSLNVEVDVEMVVFGAASPHTHLTIQGEPVSLRPDGAFAVKLPFPERRQVVPVVASSADGLHQRTIILGVERNTKSLEPRRRETPVA